MIQQMISKWDIFRKNLPHLRLFVLVNTFDWLKTVFLSGLIINWKILSTPECPESAVKYY